jgi:hypothetical protein
MAKPPWPVEIASIAILQWSSDRRRIAALGPVSIVREPRVSRDPAPKSVLGKGIGRAALTLPVSMLAMPPSLLLGSGGSGVALTRER